MMSQAAMSVQVPDATPVADPSARVATSNPSYPELSSPSPRPLTRHQRRRLAKLAEHASPSLSPPTYLTMPFPSTTRPLLIASLGNPEPYLNTLHSAGHALIAALRSQLSLPPFSRAHTFGGKGKISNASPSSSAPWTLFQSSSLMNVSGPGVAAAYKAWFRGLDAERWEKNGLLVLLHDELEAPLGKLKTKREGSARGHNGIKSVLGAVPQGTEVVRIGVGIGRPESRDKEVVSEYVLRKMSAHEKSKITEAVPELLQILERL